MKGNTEYESAENKLTVESVAICGARLRSPAYPDGSETCLHFRRLWISKRRKRHAVYAVWIICRKSVHNSV